MPKCPKCGESTTVLFTACEIIMSVGAEQDKGEEPHLYYDDEEEILDAHGGYYCPNCEKVLFEEGDKEGAIKFLMGEEVTVEQEKG